MSDNKVDCGRRRMIVATSIAGGIAAIGGATPFVASMFPSAKARAAGAPVEVDISKLEPGAKLTVEWRGKPVWIINRTKAMLDALPSLDGQLSDAASGSSLQPEYAKNPNRSIKPEFMVVEGVCTHLGCSPTFLPEPGSLTADWKGGFLCACHGSKFDLAARVFSGSPAPSNLVVPPHKYLSETLLLIGDDSKGA